MDETIEWLCKDYKVLFKDGLEAMKVHCSRVYNYLGMILSFSHASKVHITMVKYIADIYKTLEKAQAKLDNGFIEVKTGRNKSQMTAAPEHLFVVNEECDTLSESLQEVFHSCMAKVLYFAKRARRDILPSISFLTKRVKTPDEDYPTWLSI